MRTQEKKLLDQGTFGCVYHPGFTCSHEPLDIKYTTKIHAHTEKTAINEIAISEKVKTITNYEQHFSPVIDNCIVDLEKTDPELEKCSFIKEDKKNRTIPYISTKTQFIIGTTLMDYVSKHKTYAVITFLYDKLLKSVKKLEEKNIVHFDLKENNIIVKKTGEPIIIDFGISIDFDKKNKISNKDKAYLKKYFYAYTTNYKPWCVEIVLICYIVNKKTPLTKEKIMEIFDETSEPLKNKPYLNDDHEIYREAFKNKVASKPHQELMIYLLQTYKHWDKYAVSILFIQMLEKTNNEPTQARIKQLKENLRISI
jgi:serine/threonine protein kinase